MSAVSLWGIALVAVFMALWVIILFVVISLAYAAGMERGCTRADEE